MKQTLYFISLFLLLGIANANAQVGDDCQNAHVITSLPYTHSENTSSYNNGHSSTTCHSSMNNKDVVYSYTPSSNEVVNVNLTGISSYTYLQVLTGCTFTTCIQNKQLGYNGNSLAIEELSLTGGTTYYFLIERSAYPYTTAYTLNINKITCPKPSALAISNITSTTAQLNWTENGTATTWEIYATTSNTIPNATTTATHTVTTNPFTITGLTANTAYKVYVRTVCSVSDKSAWSAMAEFTTPCAAVTTFPFTEEFEGITSGQPDCWGIAGTSSSSYHWNSSSSGNSGRGMRFNSYNNSTGKTSELTTPTFDLSSLTNPELKFDFKNPTGGNFEVLISSNGGTSYTSLANNLTGQTAWTEKTYDITAHTSSNVIIKFKGTSNYGNGDAHVYLDGVVVREKPSCSKPTAVTTSNITATSADIAWASGGSGETTWEIYATTSNTVPNATTTAMHTANANPFTITGLTANSAYKVYVRAVCSASDKSVWSDAISFNTACSPYTIPYNEGFENETNGQMVTGGGCLSQVSNKWIANSSNTSYNRTPRTGNKNATLRYSNTDWIFIPISLTGGTTYTAEVYARQDGSTVTDASVGIYYGTSATVAAMTNTIKVSTGIIDGNYQEIAGNFTPSTTGIYYVGYKGTINNSPYYISIDDIKIDVAPSCLKPHTLSTSNITATSADIAWASGGSGETAWEIYATTSNTVPDATTTATHTVTTNPFTITGLTASTSYKVYVRAVCSASDKSVWSDVATFKTLCDAVDLSTGNYCQDFESNTNYITGGGCNTTSNIDVCWTSTSTEGNQWMVSRGNAYYPKKDRTLGTSVGQFAHLGTATYISCFGKTSMLTSPIFTNISSVVNPAVEFYYFMYDAGGYTIKQNLKVEITKDGGINWTELWQKTGPIANYSQWHKAEISIPATYQNATNIQIRFVGKTGQHYAQSISIDDVCIKSIPCNASSNIALSNTAGVITSTASCQEGGWTYYEGNTGEYIFAINWDPNNTGAGHNAAAKAAATVKIQKDATPKQNANANGGVFFLGRQWDVDLGSATLDGPVSIKFFYDAAEKTAAENAASTHATTNNIDNNGFKWFKQNSTYDFNTTTAANFQPEVYLTESGSGVENGKAYVELSGITSFSSGSGGAGTGSGANAALPVELLHFQAKSKGAVNQLTWSTASEINNSHFEIERSENGKDFEKIGKVAGVGNSTSTQDYTFEDAKPTNIAYYRLKQVDVDGKYEYSETVWVVRENATFAVISVQPNPTKSIAQLSFNSSQKSNLDWTVTDFSGRKIQQGKTLSKRGINTLDVDMSALANGVYFITLNNGAKTVITRVVKAY